MRTITAAGGGETPTRAETCSRSLVRRGAKEEETMVLGGWKDSPGSRILAIDDDGTLIISEGNDLNEGGSEDIEPSDALQFWNREVVSSSYRTYPRAKSGRLTETQLYEYDNWVRRLIRGLADLDDMPSWVES
jgi:hypothetical protein